MTVKKTPEEVLNSTSDNVKRLFSKILSIEQEYQHFKNLSRLKDKERELCNRIIKVINKGVQL